MKNYVIHQDEFTRFMGRRIKIICGKPKDIEKEYIKLVESEPMDIDDILQTESGDGDEWSITLTIFYSVVDQPRFIDKDLTMQGLSSLIIEHLEKEYGIDYFELLKSIDIIKQSKHMGMKS